METYLLTLYQYDELSTAAKDKAIEWFREDLRYDPFYITDSIREVFALELDELGLPTLDIQWSLNCCQGDGMAFYGEVPDVAAFLEKSGLRENMGQVFADGECLLESINILSCSNHYCHWNTMDPQFTWQGDGGRDSEHEWQLRLLDPYIKDFEAEIEEFIKNTSKRLERLGYEEIEYLESDDVLDEILSGHDYTFTVDGEREDPLSNKQLYKETG